MNFLQIFLLCSFGWTNTLTVNVPAPVYNMEGNKLVVHNASYINTIGAPNIPCRKVTVAVPAGAIVESVDFSASRTLIGKCSIEPAKPPLPMTNENAVREIQGIYERSKNTFCASNKLYPATYGRLLSEGGLRKYTTLDIACYHFAYNPSSQKLYYAPNITITIHYGMPEESTERARCSKNLKDDITFDGIAKQEIYNWEDTKLWYHTDTPRRANGYYIIIPSSLTNSVDTLVSYRQSQEYNVQVVTKEYIDANVSGVEIVQKIRNYLRNNLADIEYVLLVGSFTDLPWRQLVPFNNDPDSPWNDINISPIPSDLYYAELTDPDSLSWNSDRDNFYGEVYDANVQPNGDDDPDYHADVHLGRIPFSEQSTIQDICKKMIAFDSNTDLSYKTASLLAGAVYYYANEDHQGNIRNDGADYMEQLMDDGVLSRSNATYLYEKGGLSPCPYTCTDSLTQSNMITYWQSKGIMYECHHGNTSIYARKVWVWDDGDNVPESNEMQWPTSLYITDVYQLDNNHPATCFLRSCLCAKPEVNSLAAQLLHYGASDIVASTRISWMTFADPGGMPYHLFERLMKDTTLSGGVIGNSYDIARNDFMDATGFWLPAYHYNLYGDPALRQYGRLVGIEETEKDQRQKTRDLRLTTYPNPFTRRIEIRFSLDPEVLGTEGQVSGVWEKTNTYHLTPITFNIYNVSGRLVKSFSLFPPPSSLISSVTWDGKDGMGRQVKPGIYFVKMDGANVGKVVKVR